jgi:hypothetical protein
VATAGLEALCVKKIIKAKITIKTDIASIIFFFIVLFPYSKTFYHPEELHLQEQSNYFMFSFFIFCNVYA